MNAGHDGTQDGESLAAWRDLLLLTDKMLRGQSHGSILARLRAASLKSLLMVSRNATSPQLRLEAERIMHARLQVAPSSRPTEDEKNKKDSANAQTKKAPAKPEQLLIGMKDLKTSQSKKKPGKQTFPPMLYKIKHFLKYCNGGKWVLTTDNGIDVAVFSSEADLDEWWQRLPGKRRGRTLRVVGILKSPKVDPANQSSGSPVGNAKSDPMRPMSDKYDMPEYDFE